MLCDDVKRVVYFFLDGSLSDRKLHEFQNHLDDCPDCNWRTLLHRRLREFVRNRLNPVSAPDRLRVRLTESLRAARAE
jgi:mycothiol system anti-sigma-R factor